MANGGMVNSASLAMQVKSSLGCVLLLVSWRTANTELALLLPNHLSLVPSMALLRSLWLREVWPGGQTSGSWGRRSGLEIGDGGDREMGVH